MAESLRNWVIYFNPSDHPGRYVVRLWHILPGFEPIPTDHFWVRDSLVHARAVVAAYAPGTVCLLRQDKDDATIVEVWL